MPKLIQVGESSNINTEVWYVESQEELNAITGAPVASQAMLLTEDGQLQLWMLRSTGWVHVNA